MSIFEGKLEEIPEITIDRFNGERNLNDSTAYFLTHCHSDHMVGLKDDEFSKALRERSGVYLYTSEISYCILKNHGKYRHLESKIKPLSSIGCNNLSIPSLTDSKSFIDLQVTLIPAGHCPGSVMFFFELQRGNVLYTGDFRLSLDNIYHLSDLHHKEGTPKQITALYLDATFFDDLYPRFPRREESFKKVCSLSKEWLDKSSCNEVLINMPANYGSEFLFYELKKNLGMKIHVPTEKVSIFRNVMKICEAITDDGSQTRIHACAKERNLPSTCKGNAANFLTIRVSCMWYEKKYAVKDIITEEFFEYTRVCYACHCSKEELVDFIEYFLPERVIACAIPSYKSAAEVEKEIMDLIFACQRNRSTGSSDTLDGDKISYSMKCQNKRKMMSSPRKKRCFIPLSDDMSDDNSCPQPHSVQNKGFQVSSHPEEIIMGRHPILELPIPENDSVEKGPSTSDAHTLTSREQGHASELL